MTDQTDRDPRLKPWTEYHTLIKKMVDRCIPLTSVIELTYRCNFRCVQCYVVHEKSNKEELSVAELDTFFAQLSALGSLYLILTGGEVFVRKDFWEIMDLTQKHRFAVHIFTNGFSLTEENVERLNGYGNLLGVSISVYGGDRESFEAITKVPGSYARVMAGIKRLVDKKIRIRIKTPIISTNYCSLDQIREFCDDLDLAYRPTPMITPRDDGGVDPIEFRIDDETLKQYLRGQDLSYQDGRNPRKDIAVCSSGRSQLALAPNGEVYPCVQIRESAGNVRNKPLKQIWESSSFDFIRNLTLSQVPKCASCAVSKYCNPCVGLGWVENGSVLEPSSENCRITRLVREVYHETRSRAAGQEGER